MAARAALLAKLEKWLNGMPDTMAAGTLGRGTLTVPVGRQHSERAAARARERPATAKPAVYVSGNLQRAIRRSRTSLQLRARTDRTLSRPAREPIGHAHTPEGGARAGKGDPGLLVNVWPPTA